MKFHLIIVPLHPQKVVVALAKSYQYTEKEQFNLW